MPERMAEYIRHVKKLHVLPGRIFGFETKLHQLPLIEITRRPMWRLPVSQGCLQRLNSTNNVPVALLLCLLARNPPSYLSMLAIHSQIGAMVDAS